ncbi:glycoside hydrolase family 43 protein [Pengzhenrongella phosphoraccumulans]|uniref:glycoside hydrolase family 43 protein n=1 Tax=Pengzhenrongella phosphoraccumulans TaxID=3114394 RepID=UPI00388D7063
MAAAIALTVCLSGCASAPTTATAGTSPPPGFVIDQDFPDPDLLRVDGDYYAYATNSAAANIQVATSRDLTSWTVSGTDALPILPTWAAPGKTWAPDVSEPSPGRFVMYFTVANTTPSTQCIGVATATSPEGPFVPEGDAPLLCPVDEGGAIDPSTFLDTDGTRYLVWKNDGNSRALDTWLQLTPLSADGLTVAGPTTPLIKQTATWEGALVEAPVLVRHGSSYVLLYSANNYGDGSYAIGYATAQTITGPYVKHPEPLLSTASSDGRFTGPGGQDVVQAPDGTDWLTFHSWDPAGVYRGMNAVPLGWNGDEPVVVPKDRR